MNCLFCKIARKEIPADIIYEDEKTVAFLDIQPRALGHTMVISKYHSRHMDDLPESEIGPLFSSVKKVVGLLGKSLRPDGFTVGINQGRAGGQEVDHLHVHVFPRFKNDGGSPVQSVVSNPPKESLKEISKLIKNANHRS